MCSWTENPLPSCVMRLEYGTDSAGVGIYVIERESFSGVMELTMNTLPHKEAKFLWRLKKVLL